MSLESTVIYRKYRPETFEQVFGQEHITKVLQGSLELGNIGHAYIFSGPRGTGKTTMARIFAREIGCSEHDIIEIDAASNRGIDDIRALRESVLSLPFNSQKKMYIIDEVHMLTKEAFNALLKTLEEPPSHVIFVLATTELHKIIPTVISRCQSFIFKSPTRSILRDMIAGVVAKEGFSIDPGSLDLIAFLGNGSFRDTQGVLQKLMSYSADKTITRDEVELITGAAPEQLLEKLITALNEKNLDQSLVIIKQAQDQNIDPHILLHMLTEKIRLILHIRFSPERADSILAEIGEDDFSFLKNIASEQNNIHSTLLLELLETYKVMNHAFIPYLPLELAFFRIIGNNN